MLLTKSVTNYIGLMSGTSVDAVDGVIAQFSSSGCKVLAHSAIEFNAEFRQQIIELNTSGVDELHRSQLLANQLTDYYATVSKQLLQKTGLAVNDITAIGAHGQTVRHCPQLLDAVGGRQIGYSIQLNNPALLAELTGITVVADFRSRDIAAQGQGAPLVPAFHQQFFALPGQDSAVLNLGGIANLTLLYANNQVLGFDTGPANMLLDAWITKSLAKNYDTNGTWAQTGVVNQQLLQKLLNEDYFSAAAPKSTGRDLFNLAWLEQKLFGLTVQAQDVQRTLAELTVISIMQALQQNQPNCQRLTICGGGIENSFLIERIKDYAKKYFANLTVISSAKLGINPQAVEAVAFAWLAQQTILGNCANLPAVTGAKGSRVLGAIYPR